MFNINLLGTPGIQPDIVNNYISYRAEDKKNIKNVIVNEQPGFFTKIIDYVPSKSDYISFAMLCFIITILIYLKPISNKSNINDKVYNMISLDSIDLGDKYIIIKNVLEDIQNDKNIKLLKIASAKNYLNLKFTSNEGIKELNMFGKKIKMKYDLFSRIQGDSTSRYILSIDIPWKIYNGSQDLTKIQNFGESSYIYFIIKDLINNEVLHQGNLNVDIKEGDNYFIKFYPAKMNI